MNSCNNKHIEIFYACQECPLCEFAVHVASELDDILKKVESLYPEDHAIRKEMEERRWRERN